MVRKILKYSLLLFWPLGFLLDNYAAKNPQFAEWYAANIYKHWSSAVNFVTSFIPFSLAEVLIISLCIFLVVYVIAGILLFIKRKGSRGKTVFNFIYHLVALAGVIFFFFVTGTGVNYHRYTFSQVSNLEIRQSSVSELENLCYALAKDANAQRANLQEGEKKAAVFTVSLDDMEQLCKQAYDRLEGQYPTLYQGYGQSKAVFNSYFMSEANISGFFFPYTFEANVNTDIPDYLIPVTICHELTHLRGYMREDEANFIAYLACQESTEDMVKYSGTFHAFTQAGNQLYAQDREKYTDVYRTLSKKVRADLTANEEYWAQFQGPIAQAATKVNNTYLKANKQKDGVNSYGRMVDLLLAYYRQ